MSITFKDVAKLAGVSTQTVSRVTNGSQHVADNTRKRVNDAIKQLGYLPNKGAQMLSRAKSNVIGVISLDIALHGVALIANGIRTQAQSMGYATTLSIVNKSTTKQTREALKELISQQVESVIVNFPFSRQDAEALIEQYPHLHFVFLDLPLDSHANYVSSNNEKGAQLAIQKLVALKRQDFLLIAGPTESTISQRRCQQWITDIEASGKRVAAKKVGDWQASSAYIAVRDCVAQHIKFDAVVVANDQMALGALAALNELNIDVPQQVSVIGFDNIADSAFFSPSLTTIHQNFVEIGKQAVIAAIAAQQPQSGYIQKVIDVSLVERNSCIEKNSATANKTKIKQKLKELTALIE